MQVMLQAAMRATGVPLFLYVQADDDQEATGVVLGSFTLLIFSCLR